MKVLNSVPAHNTTKEKKKNAPENEYKAFFRRIKLKAHYEISLYEPNILESKKEIKKPIHQKII